MFKLQSQAIPWINADSENVSLRKNFCEIWI